MEIKKNSFGLLLTYATVMLFPSILFLIVKNNTLLFYATLCCSLLGVATMFHLNKKNAYKNNLEKKTTTVFSSLLWGIGGAIVALVLQHFSLIVETGILGQSVSSQNTAEALAIMRRYPFYLVYLVGAAPLMEEFVFRKVLFGNLGTLIPPIGAALISSILFSIAHADGHFLTYALLGLFFCYLYRKTGRLLTSMTAHILMNAIIIVLQFVI
ncbi:CPBP family intramembrane glutamic endopeptidase [Liquorilactobacillus satsumensis]|uniref:CPBP family intramembrane glutamic endopeptidase n=1 Tax=Liquorilactobacillus satsumensis TaxID=259059 RepID=UPI001E61083B|nr:type II CAAX endopeptidase family protein [Liquorilactobacillus satsumensis]MCC7665779.1 CPBP family intramembrane metalloprotease [Liquorilactobacillus satsumensis]MCP9356426.1 CPBP family intramembrane metalloprotease [Liquorilactobacillus satsumensis]MCP9370435.1 CPBP family intramembrane metalloprotease [Liquorilactobacillus satsumensis]